MTRMILIVNRILEGVLITLMALMTLNVLWQIFTRFVLGDPSSYTEEIARFLLIWVGLLGASYTAGAKKHLAIDILSNRLSGAAREYLEIFIDLSLLAFAMLVLVIGGARLVYLTLSLRQSSAALQIPLGIVYLVIPVSGILIVFYALDSLRRAVSSRPHREKSTTHGGETRAQ
jgi:TRAP-type C4-dicarboxylate transport system permease small subunit